MTFYIAEMLNSMSIYKVLNRSYCVLTMDVIVHLHVYSSMDVIVHLHVYSS